MDYLGEQLQEARNKKGVSLEEAAAATRIKVEYLRFLEEGDYPNLPPRAYVKGFLKIYGHYLSLEYSRLLQIYEESFQSSEPQVVFLEPKPDSPPLFPGIHWKPLLLFVAVVIFLALLAWGGVLLFRGLGARDRAAVQFIEVDKPFAPGTLEKIPVSDLESPGR
jgi:cytoskeletal protein RodZ